MDRKLSTTCGGSCVLHWKLHPQSSHGSITCILMMEEFSLDTPRNRLWSYHLSGSMSSCHDGSMLSKGGAVEKPSLNASPTHTTQVCRCTSRVYNYVNQSCFKIKVGKNLFTNSLSFERE